MSLLFLADRILPIFAVKTVPSDILAPNAGRAGFSRRQRMAELMVGRDQER